MIRRLWRMAVLAWALRTSWLAAAYVLAWSGVERHHVETAGFILAGLLLLETGFDFSTYVISKVEKSNPVSTPILLALLAYAAYWPALSVGLLSDDFVLLERASTWTLIDPAWEMVRPVPIALWGVVERLLPDTWLAPALHALNIGLHGANAWLVAALMRRLGYDAPAARAAAALFLLFPASVEAVAWISGMADVLLTTLTLAVVWLSASPVRSRARVAMVMALAVAALLTKETAIAIPALVLIAAWAGGQSGWTLIRTPIARTAGGLAALVIAYIGWRLAGGAGPSAFPQLSGYAAKELLTRPFGALAIPFHESVIARMPFAVATVAAMVPLILAGRMMLPARPPLGGSRLLSGVALWVLASAAPVFTWFFVGADLQGSRYVYLASTGWSMLLAALLVGAGPDRRWRPVGLLAVAVWAAFSAIAVRAHLTHWTGAASARDAALAAALRADPSCAPPSGIVPPQDVDGAYVFRNGFAEALRRECRSQRAR